MTSQNIPLTAAAVAVAAFAWALPGALPAQAQGIGPQGNAIASPVPLPEAISIHAKITNIDLANRNVTLRGADGHSVTVHAGAAVTNLDQLKVGDTVNARFYRSVAFLVNGPGATAPENAVALAVSRPVQGPGGEVLALTRISAIVVGIDLPAHSIDVVDPTGGAVRTITVTDPSRIALLPQLNVGDTVTAVVSSALAISITPAPRSWF
jgi:hypothetical protein